MAFQDSVLPNPTRRAERDYFSSFYGDERRPVIIRELGENGEVLDEELDYSGGYTTFALSGHRYLIKDDGTSVNIDMAYDDPNRYQPPNEWNSHQEREDWYAKYRPSTS